MSFETKIRKAAEGNEQLFNLLRNEKDFIKGYPSLGNIYARYILPASMGMVSAVVGASILVQNNIIDKLQSIGELGLVMGGGTAAGAAVGAAVVNYLDSTKIAELKQTFLKRLKLSESDRSNAVDIAKDVLNGVGTGVETGAINPGGHKRRTANLGGDRQSNSKPEGKAIA